MKQLTDDEKRQVRVARHQLELIALQLRVPSSPNLERALAMVRRAAKRLELELERRRIVRCGTSPDAAMTRAEPYIELDDGTRVSR